jgi:Ribbon-helix-helix protein, copG family
MVVLCGFMQRDWQGTFLTMARPKGRQLPNRVSVALTDQQLTALESLAQESQAAVSWVVRRAVAEYLERNCPPVTTDSGRTTYVPVTGNDDGTGDHQL